MLSKAGGFLAALLGGAAGALGVLIIAVVIGWSPARNLLDASAPLAGWMQAVFSVAAIWVAARLVNLESMQKDVATMEAFRGVCIAVDRLVQDATHRSEDHLLNGEALHDFPSRLFAEAKLMLDNTPTFDLGSTQAASLLLDMKSAVLLMEGYTHRVKGDGNPVLNIAEIRRLSAESTARVATVSKYADNRRAISRRWLWPAPKP